MNGGRGVRTRRRLEEYKGSGERRAAAEEERRRPCGVGLSRGNRNRVKAEYKECHPYFFLRKKSVIFSKLRFSIFDFRGLLVG